MYRVACALGCGVSLTLAVGEDNSVFPDSFYWALAAINFAFAVMPRD